MLSRKIEYFLTLAECLSFTQTAAKYNVSQTAISQYIASLEERLGVRLFTRTQRSVALTEAGRYLYERTRDSMRRYDETMAHLKALDQNYHGCLKVGVGLYEYVNTEDFISSFLTSHREVKLDILQYPYSVLTEKLRTGELDVIIGDELCEDAFAANELKKRVLFASPNELVASPALLERLGVQTVEDALRRSCLITNCEGSGPSSMTFLHKLLMEEYGFVPELIEQTNSVNAQLMMVRAAHGVAMVPGFVAEVQGAGLVRSEWPSHRRIRYELLSLAASANPFTDTLMEFEA